MADSKRHMPTGDEVYKSAQLYAAPPLPPQPAPFKGETTQDLNDAMAKRHRATADIGSFVQDRNGNWLGPESSNHDTLNRMAAKAAGAKK